MSDDSDDPYSCDGSGEGYEIMLVILTPFHLCFSMYFLFNICASLKDDSSDHVISSGKRTLRDINIERVLKYLAIAALICSSVNPLGLTVRAFILCGWTDSNSNDDINSSDSLPFGIFITCFLINLGSYMALFIVFFTRLVFCFADTSYAVSGCFKSWFFFMFGVAGVMGVLIVILGIIDFDRYFRIAMALLGIGSFLYVSHIIVLLITFVRKLELMITTFVDQFGKITTVQLAAITKSVSIQIMEEETGINPSDGVNKAPELGDGNVVQSIGIDGMEEVKVDGKNESTDNIRKLSLMIRDMSKYTILVSIATCSSLLLMLFFLLVGANAFDYAAQMAVILTIIDGIVNNSCLYLQFYFSRKAYRRFCISLTKYCESRYTKDINHKLKKGETLLKLSKLDEKGTLVIEKIYPDQPANGDANGDANGGANNGDDNERKEEEKNDGQTNNQQANENDANKRAKAFADMRSFSQHHLD